MMLKSSMACLLAVNCLYLLVGLNTYAMDTSQPYLVMELILKNAPGYLSYHDIGACAVASKPMRPMLLETAPYRKAFMIQHFQAALPKHIVWNAYATACAYVGKPLGFFNNTMEMWYGITTLSFMRRQLTSRTGEGKCIICTFTTMIGTVLPSPTMSKNGSMLWYCKGNKKHGLKRAYCCSQPYFDDRGNAHVTVQQMIGSCVDQDATKHYTIQNLNSDGDLVVVRFG